MLAGQYSMKIEPITKKQAEVEIINSIKHSHKDLRQKSKTCTFALTYGGTPQTLVKNQGFSLEEAEQIYNAYHELYKESDEWVNKKLESAEQKGYVDVAFGLRVRTHKIKQALMGTSKTPHEAEAERRTAGNALGQSYGLLNTRAGIEFNEKVRNSPYREYIKPTAQIHDAQYFLIRDLPEVVLWVNKELNIAVSWQDEPGIRHPDVHLGGELSIFYPDWAHELVLPNELTEEKLIELVKEYLQQQE